MAEITIEVPDTIATALGRAGTLKADHFLLIEILRWNISFRADRLKAWGEEGPEDLDASAAENRRTAAELAALTEAYESVVRAPTLEAADADHVERGRS